MENYLRIKIIGNGGRVLFQAERSLAKINSEEFNAISFGNPGSEIIDRIECIILEKTIEKQSYVSTV